MAVGFYQLLTQIENETKDLNPDERLWIRQQRAVPILAKFKEWIIEVYPKEPPNSPIRKAANYCLKRWDPLTYYTKDGNVPFSTNDLERMMKSIAIGRKNFLHASSELGARAVAILYSLVLTCKGHAIDPFYYLSDVLRRVGEHPASKVAELLPHTWRILFMEEAIQRYQSPFKTLQNTETISNLDR